MISSHTSAPTRPVVVCTWHGACLLEPSRTEQSQSVQQTEKLNPSSNLTFTGENAPSLPHPFPCSDDMDLWLSIKSCVSFLHWTAQPQTVDVTWPPQSCHFKRSLVCSLQRSGRLSGKKLWGPSKGSTPCYTTLESYFVIILPIRSPYSGPIIHTYFICSQRILFHAVQCKYIFEYDFKYSNYRYTASTVDMTLAK